MLTTTRRVEHSILAAQHSVRTYLSSGCFVVVEQTAWKNNLKTELVRLVCFRYGHGTIINQFL